MIEYEAQLENIPSNSTDFTQAFVFGSTELIFRFFWCEDIEEEVRNWERALQAQRLADPLLNTETGYIERSYDWLDWYCDTVPHNSTTEIKEWYEETHIIPQSLKTVMEQSEAVALSQWRTRCAEAEEIREAIRPYKEQLVWHVEITDSNNFVVSGVVRAGGWLNSQDEAWRVQFESSRELGKDDLGELTINCEVPESD